MGHSPQRHRPCISPLRKAEEFGAVAEQHRETDMLLDCFKSDRTVFVSFAGIRKGPGHCNRRLEKCLGQASVTGSTAGTRAPQTALFSWGRQEDTSQPPPQVGWGPHN